MRRSRASRSPATMLALSLAGLFLLVVVLLFLLDRRRIQTQIAGTEADLAGIQPGVAITEVLPALPGFSQLTTIPIAQYDPTVVTVYRKNVGSRHATGMQWDICVDGHGRVIGIRREGSGHR